MKPQLYSIVILLLARINYAQNAENSTQGADTQSPLIPTTTYHTTISVVKPLEDNVTSTTIAPDDLKTSAPPQTTENNVTSVTNAPQGNTNSVTETSREISTEKVLSEAPTSKATSAPSLAPNVSPARTTKGFTTTTRSGGIPRATGSTSVSIGNQTSNPTVVGNATTQWNHNVTSTALKIPRPTSKKPTTDKATGNGTSAFPVPSLFAIVSLVVSVLCF